MNQRNTIKWKFLLIVGVMIVLLTTSTVLAQSPGENPVADFRVEETSLSWLPMVEYEGLTLTVSGPGSFYWQKLFKAGEIPTFNANEVGSALPDGSYNYELFVLPSAEGKIRDESNEFIHSDPAMPIVQSGAFTVFSGSFVAENVSDDRDGDDPMLLDHVILDDLIVDGSACVGFDCVNGESFGFDTIRLKENNLRIKFQDTSSTASYPSNDWQITANDSTNGGANKFSIDDIDGGRTPFTIEAGSQSNSLYVDSNTNIGFGTNSPVLELHVKDNDSPGVRLEQDGSGGWPPQTWDIAGNESNFFIRDVTNGSLLPFRIQPGAPSNALSVKSDGSVGVGTWNPRSALHVVGENGIVTIQNTENNNTAKQLRLVAGHYDNNEEPVVGVYINSVNNNVNSLSLGGGTGLGNAATRIIFYTAANATTTTGTEQMRIDSSGRVGIGKTPALGLLDVDGDIYANGAIVQTSDVNAKENFSVVNNREVLALLAEIPISSWNFKADESKALHIGPMAQDFSVAFGFGTSDKHIATVDSDGVALAAIQGLNEILEEKDAQIEEMETRLSALESRHTPNNQVSINTLLSWFLLTITMVVLAWIYGKRQAKPQQN